MKKNVSIDEALNVFLENWQDKMPVENIPIAEGEGRVLAKPIHALSDIPLVRASAMDGICVKSELFEDGKPVNPDTWLRGEAYDFADTGDDFPDAFDSVIRIEDVTFNAHGQGIRFSNDLVLQKGMNILPKGHFIKKDQIIKEAPALLGSTDVAAIAMGNHGTLPVYRKPRVAFVPTGSELVDPGEPLHRGMNVNSNVLLAQGMLSSFGAEMVKYPIVRDERALLKKHIDEAMLTCDLILVNGGSSKGSEDLALDILEKEGEILFHWVNCGPGRPTALARIKNKPVIVVPGPPYGCLNVLDWFVRPVIAYWLHLPETPRRKVRAILTEDVRRDRSFGFLMGVELTRNDDGQLQAKLLNFKKHGAARCLTAEGMFRLLPGMRELRAGDTIDVTLLRECL
ncbi:MAG: molybdopterin molybdotransferase MoeA [Saccharofermentanales bacterium]